MLATGAYSAVLGGGSFRRGFHCLFCRRFRDGLFCGLSCESFFWRNALFCCGLFCRGLLNGLLCTFCGVLGCGFFSFLFGGHAESLALLWVMVRCTAVTMADFSDGQFTGERVWPMLCHTGLHEQADGVLR